MRALLFEVSASDLRVVVSAIAIVALLAGVAALLPAMKAMGTDPRSTIAPE
jgi:hypothetical protein